MTLTIAQMAEPYAVIECDDGYNLRVWSCAWGGEERTGGPRGVEIEMWRGAVRVLRGDIPELIAVLQRYVDEQGGDA